MTGRIEAGNAPVSYGAFERTVGIDENVPAGRDVLDAVAEAGYRGIDLGPPGYLGDQATLGRDLADRGLLLTGGYLEVDVSSAAAIGSGLAELRRLLDLFDSAAPVAAELRARPTIALVSGALGGAVSRAADPATWEAAVGALRRVTALARERGYEPCLHNEVGTIVAGPDAIAIAAGQTDVSLCVDTGHLLAAGGDPIEVLERWWPRVDHIHLKDVSAGGLDIMGSPAAVASDVWVKGVFCPLGTGAGRIEEIVSLLKSRDYSGWVVVEQDVLPDGPGGYRRAAEDQAANRAYLRGLGL